MGASFMFPILCLTFLLVFDIINKIHHYYYFNLKGAQGLMYQSQLQDVSLTLTL